LTHPEVDRLLRDHGIVPWTFPDRHVADERLRWRRSIWGDTLVFAAVLVVEGDRIVLVREAEVPAPGGWTLPGGSVEPGESIEAGALREVREECGLDVELGPPVAVAAFRLVGDEVPPVSAFDVTFRGRRTSGVFRAGDPEEIAEVAWVPLADVESWAEDGRLTTEAPFGEAIRRAVSILLSVG